MGTYALEDYPRIMRAYAKQFGKFSEKAVQDMSAKALVEFVYGTPKDSNRAISNWQVSLSAPPKGYLPTYTPGAKGGAGSAAVAAVVVGAGVAKITSWRAKGNGAIFIGNNAPYIYRLNDGSHSSQPGGFIEAGFQAALEHAKTVKLFKQL